MPEFSSVAVLYVQYVKPGNLSLLYDSSRVNACFNEAQAKSFIKKSKQHTCLLLECLAKFSITFSQYFIALF